MPSHFASPHMARLDWNVAVARLIACDDQAPVMSVDGTVQFSVAKPWSAASAVQSVASAP